MSEEKGKTAREAIEEIYNRKLNEQEKRGGLDYYGVLREQIIALAEIIDEENGKKTGKTS